MSSETDGQRKAPTALVIIAFAAVYIIWGSTYLGIRFAVETLPPFLMGGMRFLTAGLILYVWLRVTGTKAPAEPSWRIAAVAAALLLGIGNGGVNWAEQKVPSGLTALIIAGTPVWFALFDWLRPRGVRPAFQTILGIAIGFAGVVMLVSSRSSNGVNAASPAGLIALVFASIAWAIGSLYTKYTPKQESPLMTAAQQMLVGGAILTLMGIAMGEIGRFQVTNVSTRSFLAFVYLTLIGSLVGFTAYAWLLKATTPARASTYAYVNPVIALFLGWALGGETLTSRMLVAAAVIVAGVVVITTRRTSLLSRSFNGANGAPCTSPRG